MFNKNILKLIEPNPLPETNADLFMVLIEIYDVTEEFIETKRGNYNVTIFFKTDSQVYSDFITTSEGKCELSKFLDNIGNI